MPIHDWTPAGDNLFHHLHNAWGLAICDALNGGILPSGYGALIEQRAGSIIPDVLAVRPGPSPPPGTEPGAPQPFAAVIDRPNRTRPPGRPRSHAVIRHEFGPVVTIIEIVSRGNKATRRDLAQLCHKVRDHLDDGVGVLALDLLPPTKAAPENVHPPIWNYYSTEPSRPPAGRPVTLASYRPASPNAGPEPAAFVEWRGYGELLPEVAVFLGRGPHVVLPLEAAYSAVWGRLPGFVRDRVAPT